MKTQLKIREILEKLNDSEISCRTDKRTEARIERIAQAKLAIKAEMLAKILEKMPKFPEQMSEELIKDLIGVADIKGWKFTLEKLIKEINNQALTEVIKVIEEVLK